MAPMLRRHCGPTMPLRGTTVESVARLTSPFRRPYVGAPPSRPPMSHSTTSSLKSEQPFEGRDAEATSQHFVTFYLDMIRSRLRRHASLLSSAASLNFTEIGGRLNKVTGYEHIEELKHKVIETGAVPLIQLDRALITSHRGIHNIQATSLPRCQSGLRDGRCTTFKFTTGGKRPFAAQIELDRFGCEPFHCPGAAGPFV